MASVACESFFFFLAIFINCCFFADRMQQNRPKMGNNRTRINANQHPHQPLHQTQGGNHPPQHGNHPPQGGNHPPQRVQHPQGGNQRGPIPIQVKHEYIHNVKKVIEPVEGIRRLHNQRGGGNKYQLDEPDEQDIVTRRERRTND